jgi:1,2-diacylglycerol 3-alpha-glucosyltransferase
MRIMRVLMISSDRNILTLKSAVSERMREYGNFVDKLDIVLLCDKKHNLNQSNISNNVTVWPTNSKSKYLRPIDALKISKSISADLITAQDPFECGWAASKIKDLTNLPLEVQLHTDPFSREFNGWLNFFRKLIMSSIVRKAESIRVVLSTVGKEIQKKYGINGERISVLPIYIDRKRIADGRSIAQVLHKQYGFSTIALSLSRLSEEKNISLAIKAMSLVVKQNPSCGLFIVGLGPEEKKLRNLTKSLNLEKNVIFLGWIDDVAKLYGEADMFIQTSKFEGYGLSLVEAGLSGLCVVSTRVGVANELPDVIKIDNAEALVQKINFLIEHEDERLSIGESLKKSLEAVVYTKEAYLMRLKENWMKLVSKKMI